MYETSERKRIDSDFDSDAEYHKSTLKNWLQNNQINWSKTYKYWGANRPSHSACKLIKAIILSVHEFHGSRRRRIHGSLKFEENYVLYMNVEGNISVELVHNEEDGDISTKTKEGDIKDMLSIIFDKILAGVPQLDYAPDLKCLHALIKNCDGSRSDWLHIIKHPSLWHYEEKVNFICRLHRLLENDRLGNCISSKLNRMNKSLGDWRKLVTDTSLHEFLHRDAEMYPRYKKTAREHLRFFRNFLTHFRTYYRDSPKKRRYEDEKYAEFLLSMIPTNFVVKLFEMVMADSSLRRKFFHVKLV